MILTNSSGERLILTVWVGSLLAIGYIAVPLAFVDLGDVVLAGHFAGKLFFAVNMLGLGCGVILVISKLIGLKQYVIQSWRFWVVIMMLLVTLVFSFYLQPVMVDIKQTETWSQQADLAQRFTWFHSVSKNLYLLLTLLGLSLVVSADKVTDRKLG